MAKESFMLVSLKEDKAKKLAQVMANPTCTRILEYLAGKDATETQIATDLKVPLSTVHYNLQQLAAAKLVVVDEFHYSEKGREVNHYKLANRYIIIAPAEDDPSFLQHLKKYLPAFTIIAGVAIVIKALQFFTATREAAAEAGPSLMMAKTAALDTAAPQAMAGLAPQAAQVAAEAPTLPWWQSPVVDYMIAGAVFVLLVILVIEAINYWREQRSRRK
jgi:DNA-binding transcriptional ArsR family regulator